MPRAQIRPGDVTGREKARLEKEKAAEIEARAKELSMNAQVKADEDAAPVDLTQGPNARPEVQVAEVVEVRAAEKRLRVNTALEDVTIGAGNHYNFEEGREYIVPAHIYNHLEEKGYVWH